MIVLHLSTVSFKQCSLRGQGIRADIRLLLLFPSLPFPLIPTILSLEGVFTADYVRGELVAVSAAVTTDVALQWISVSVAAHMDGVHDMVQEEHPTVLTLEGPQLLALSSKHPNPFMAREPFCGRPHCPCPHSCPTSG